ncbi:hypothetical protein JTE90_013372 [Oedothorax gibbosus]|uniref:Uncharacterized protein n=1 Tax=Oedothorax gibbosus TaxID=931172 RepID=A0AAV6TVW9_9ARAC|nr:hypothetical protein JTE90_013372 [Oedothorax gibbosus]
MPRFCGIYDCGRTEKRDGGRYFLLPQFLSKGSDLKKQLTVKRRQRWLDVIKRADITDAGLKYLLVCDQQFISGAPSDVNNPDWEPNQRLGYETTGCSSDEAMARY